MLGVLMVLGEAQGRCRSANGECSWAELGSSLTRQSSQCFVSHSSPDGDGIASKCFPVRQMHAL